MEVSLARRDEMLVSRTHDTIHSQQQSRNPCVSRRALTRRLLSDEPAGLGHSVIRARSGQKVSRVSLLGWDGVMTVE